jgi:rhodanese-related sulfurtransferase
MKTSKLAILLIVVTGQIFAQVPDSQKFKSLDPYYFHLNYLKEERALIIDVREPFEFRGKRLKDAVNIPASGNLEFAADTIDKDYALFFYCTTDYRSKRVAVKFYDYGFRKIYNLEGGIAAWRKEGMVTERKRVHDTRRTTQGR